MKLQFLLTVSVAGLLITLVAPVALAGAVQQTVTCEQDYIVQADDWLSKLAGKFYGDIFAYPAIVAATNAAATVDDSYTAITNPDLIEVGQKLCIPSAEAVAAGEYLADELGQTEPSLVWVDGVQAEVTDSGQVAVTVQANYPDSCSTLGEVETVVEGNTVTVTMYAERPPGLTCAQALVPFEETVTLDIGDAEPGDYTVTINDSVTTSVTIP
jgi:LysM repeat protein